MAQDGSANHLQQIFHSFLVKKLKSWNNAKKWAKHNDINENTMRGAWYRPHGIGVQVMNTVLSKLLNLSHERVAALEECIDKLKLVSESTAVWNSLKIPEDEKLRLAYISKAIWEIESKIKEKA